MICKDHPELAMIPGYELSFQGIHFIQYDLFIKSFIDFTFYEMYIQYMYAAQTPAISCQKFEVSIFLPETSNYIPGPQGYGVV